MGSFSEAQARQWAEEMQARFGAITVASAGAEAVAAAQSVGSVQDLIDRLIANLGNVDSDEAAAILAKLTEATALFAAGNWFAGVFSVMEAFSMYRQAIAD